MALEAHIAELIERHQNLEQEIDQELYRPSGDDLRISELKRRKLRLKEEIARLTADRAA